MEKNFEQFLKGKDNLSDKVYTEYQKFENKMNAQQSSLEDGKNFLLETAKVPFSSLLTHPPSSPYPGRKVLVWILPSAPEICSIFQGDAFVVIASLDSTHKITIEEGHLNSKLLTLMVRMPDTYKHFIVAQALIQSEDKVSIQLFSQFVKKNLSINPMVVNLDNSAGERSGVKEVWPHVYLVLCLWHSLKTVKKHLSLFDQPLTLQVNYYNNNNCK